MIPFWAISNPDLHSTDSENGGEKGDKSSDELRLILAVHRQKYCLPPVLFQDILPTLPFSHSEPIVVLSHAEIGDNSAFSRTPKWGRSMGMSVLLDSAKSSRGWLLISLGLVSVSWGTASRFGLPPVFLRVHLQPRGQAIRLANTMVYRGIHVSENHIRTSKSQTRRRFDPVLLPYLWTAR